MNPIQPQRRVVRREAEQIFLIHDRGEYPLLERDVVAFRYLLSVIRHLKDENWFSRDHIIKLLEIHQGLRIAGVDMSDE
jgi:hypothetical protein